MFIDTRKLDSGQSITAQICIIGAGAAGITMARELANKNVDVCLLESGGFEYDLPTQALYKGTNSGISYDPLEVARLRYFGGTTNHWAGWTRPLDPMDFESREWIPHSGWPISRADLDPYYKRAEAVLQLGEHDYEPKYWLQQSQQTQSMLDRGALETRVFRFSPPTRFGNVYRQEIEASTNIKTYLHANVVDIELDAQSRSVTGLKVVTLDGGKHDVNAKVYILATGGIENARLLLAANKVQTTGIGNQHDLVGRFFADHFGILAGMFILSDTSKHLEFYKNKKAYNINSQSGAARAAITLSRDEFKKQKIMNFSGLVSEKSWAHFFDSAVDSNYGTFGKHVGTIARNIDDWAVDEYRSIFAKHKREKIFEVIAMCEPVPNPDSRVSLINEIDALGMPRVDLNWQFSEHDQKMTDTIRESLALEFGAAGLGRMLLENDNWPPKWIEYGRHHMGTTRMHDDPKQGVVDANCKIHDVKNLYIAGSSVFTTYGYAQPTFTLTALAIRLSDHLRQKVLG